MNESESKNEKPKEGRRFDPELLKKGLRCDLDQYDMLKRCSDKKDMTEWNEWRKKNPNEDILLEGANFIDAHLEDTDFSRAHLQGAYFMDAHLEHSNLNMSNMVNTMLRSANMSGATLNNANLQGAEFLLAIVDGSTLLWHCEVSRYSKDVNFTDFRGVALVSVRIDPATRQLLEYNIRRKNWEKRYEEQHWSLRWLVRKFWKISDYGISTKQIIKTFFKLAFVFAIIYYIWGFIDYYLVGIKDYPGIVSDLFVLEDYQEAVSCWLVPFRAVYFS